MVALESRTGRHRQLYEKGYRLVAGCIPYRYTSEPKKPLEVLMVTPHRGDGLMFPKGGWEDDETNEQAACREALEEAGVKGDITDPLGSWDFRSRRRRDEHSPEGLRKGYMFALLVTKLLDTWPEKDVRQRKWVTVEEAKGLLRHGWMREALEECERICLTRKLQNPLSESVDIYESPVSLSQLSDEEHTEQEHTEQFAYDESVVVSESPVSLSQLSDEEPIEQFACDDDDTPSCSTEESASSFSE